MLSVEIMGVSRDLNIFLIFFRQGVSVPSFIIVEYVIDFRERGGGGDKFGDDPLIPLAALSSITAQNFDLQH